MEQGGAGLLQTAVEAMRDGRWSESVAHLESALDALPEPELRASALDLLADARWRLGEATAAIADREEVYRLRRETGDLAGAARAAAWLAREHATGQGNVSLGRGWLGRAETLQRDLPDVGTAGWVALARAMLADTAVEQSEHAQAAVDAARTVHDADLELLALSRLGLALVMQGKVQPGLARLDEAMAAVTAGDAAGATEAQLCCDLVVAGELSGDPAWFAQWVSTVDQLAASRGQPSPTGFCTTCTAETAAAHGDFAAAEQRLHLAVVELDESGWRSRCIAPGTKLAELYLDQGRLEEAERALGEPQDSAALLLSARIALAQDRSALAATLAERAARRLGPSDPRALAALGVLAEAQLASDPQAAAGTVTRMVALAEDGADPRGTAEACVAQGRLAAQAGDRSAACEAFERALDAMGGTLCAEAAAAHLELARLRADEQPEVARVDAKAALRGFEAVGAARMADAAGALLRSMGDHTRVGPKDVGTLSKREQEVLRLVAQGLTNAEIAGRLFISTKTAGHHVSAILSKLGVRSRTEAAAVALVHARD